MIKLIRLCLFRGAASVLALATVACTSSPAPTSLPTAPVSSVSTASPSSAVAAPSPLASLPWQLADVQLPSAVTDPPSLEPGYLCHPCHYQAENQLLAVSKWPTGLIAVGVQAPPPQAIAMTSSDGLHWTAAPGFSGAAGTTAAAVTATQDRTVIVGLQHSGATAWAFDGQSWAQAPDQESLHVDYAAGGMTAATFTDGQFVAGGYADDPLNDKSSAAAWRSGDGLTWQRDDDPTGVFAGGRIWSMATRGDIVVAVGTNGDPIYGPAGAWRWTPAAGWQRGTIEPSDSGAMAAVAVGPNGFVAVGKNGQDLGASVWTSSDGLTWTAVPDQPSLHYYQLALRMQSIVSTPHGFLVGGWRSDVAKGSGVIWTSGDGLTWSAPTWEDEFSGGQITGVALLNGSGVAVGRTGYPDWNQATIWLDPNPFGS